MFDGYAITSDFKDYQLLYNMFSYCCSQSKTEVDISKEKVEDMRKQINNIYEMLEVLTNESKAKNILEQFNNNNVRKEDHTTPTACSAK